MNVKTYVVSVVYLDDISSSFAARSAATSKKAAISAVLKFHRKSRSTKIDDNTRILVEEL